MSAPHALIISGPTASGKSALSLQLAELLNGEIINIDSVQMYREADIGSAKPTPADRERVPHHLIDTYSPDQQVTAWEISKRVGDLSRTLVDVGKLPIIVGSPGLYLTAVVEGLSPLSPPNPEFRQAASTLSTTALFARLQQVDPGRAAELHPNDRVRIERALEVVGVAGVSYRELQAQGRVGAAVNALCLVLFPDRQKLYEQINRRAALMMELGLVEEVIAIRDRYGQDSPLLRALGYAQVNDVLSGNALTADPTGSIAQMTRRYAKRQYTFWRNEPIKRGWRRFILAPGDHRSLSRFELQEEMIYVRGAIDAQLSYAEVHLTSLAAALAEGLDLRRKSTTTHEVWYLGGRVIE